MARVNKCRAEEGQQDRVSYEVFEIVMNRLEKEWFDLVCATVLQVNTGVTDSVYRRRIYQNQIS